jgi:hypothetical protein
MRKPSMKEGNIMMPIVLRDPGVGKTLDEYYVEAGKGVKIRIRIAEVVREDGSKEYCCFADEPPLTTLDETIYTMTLGEIGPPENLFWAHKREDLYLLFKENLRKVASKLKVEIAEDQESRLLYYMTREVRHSILEPFILDENIKDIKVISPGLNALVIHKDYDFLGWLKTNAVFTDARHTKELMARLVEKGPTNPPAES